MIWPITFVDIRRGPSPSPIYISIYSPIETERAFGYWGNRRSSSLLPTPFGQPFFLFSLYIWIQRTKNFFGSIILLQSTQVFLTPNLIYGFILNLHAIIRIKSRFEGLKILTSGIRAFFDLWLWLWLMFLMWDWVFKEFEFTFIWTLKSNLDFLNFNRLNVKFVEGFCCHVVLNLLSPILYDFMLDWEGNRERKSKNPKLPTQNPFWLLAKLIQISLGLLLLLFSRI